MGIFAAFIGALFLGFTPQEASSIGIIGGADGPTAIFVTSKLAPHLLGAIAVAAYSYMALVPVIQPPIMKAFTSEEARKVVMKQLRPVSKTEKIIFPVMVTIIVVLLLPDCGALIGMLMLGNLFRESGCTDRLSDTAQNALMNIVTIALGTTVGSTANAEVFLTAQTLGILCMGLAAFALGTFGGIIMGNIFYKLSGGQVNPLIGSAGVSLFLWLPVYPRLLVLNTIRKTSANACYGPNVAGVIGSAVAAGVLLSMFG